MSLRPFVLISLLSAIIGFGGVTAGDVFAQEDRGEIAGHIEYDRLTDSGTNRGFEGPVIIVPAGIEQPITFADAAQYFVDDFDPPTGNFSMPGLAAGEYLIGLAVNPDYVPSFTEMVVILDNRGEDLGVRPSTTGFPAMRISVGRDQVLSDVVITINLPVFPTSEPITTLEGLRPGTGSISGRVYAIGCESCQGNYRVLVVPAELDHPLEMDMSLPWHDFAMSTDSHGYYLVTDMAPGDYLVGLSVPNPDLTEDLSDEIAGIRGDGSERNLPAKRIHLDEGEALTGIDFVQEARGQTQDVLGAPAADSGSDQSWNAIAAYVGVGVAVLIVLFLAAGVANRVRKDRATP